MIMGYIEAMSGMLAAAPEPLVILAALALAAMLCYRVAWR